MRFVRERTVNSAGKYKDVDLYTLTTEQDTWHRKRKRKKLSEPKQVRLDWKHARQYATQLVNANFGPGDYLVDLTYETEPPDRETAERNVKNYAARLKNLYAKHGKVFKAFWVTGGGHPRANGEGLTRFHHHMIISGGVSRDMIEDKWTAGRTKCSRVKIQTGEFGLEPRVVYMVKPAHCSDTPNAKRWHTCGPLKKPIETRNDNRYTAAAMEKLIKAIKEEQANDRIEKLYRGWEVVEVVEKSNPVTGLPQVRIKLQKKE